VARVLRPARLGPLERLNPLDDRWGYSRGTPVDRHYVDGFLERHAADIRGRVLEVKDDGYARRFGSRVDAVDVIDIDPDNPRATIVADLTAASAIPDGAFDCFLLTQTVHLIYDVQAVVAEAHRVLKPGGVLLVTVPTLSRVLRDGDRPVDYWRFTSAACERLFGDVFGRDQVQVEAHGNVLTAVAFLMGMALEELEPQQLDHRDPRFENLVCVRAVKA
jgi:SAM-dependent methyltransferase